MPDWLAAFRAGLPDDADELVLDPAFGEQLREAYAAARNAWESVDVGELRYAAHLAARIDTAMPVDDALEALHTSDLYLACACEAGDEAALRHFDERYLAPLPQTLAKLRPAHQVVGEIRQRLRENLLVQRPDRPPAIATYRGRGELAHWVKVVAIREATHTMRSDHHTPADDDELEALLAPNLDPEFDLIRAQYREAFRSGFSTALTGLEPRERNILRYHLIERLSIDKIAAIYGVHRATAARWLGRIRDTLFRETRRGLTRALDISPAEFESVVRVLRSQLEASIVRHLESTDPE